MQSGGCNAGSIVANNAEIQTFLGSTAKGLSFTLGEDDLPVLFRPPGRPVGQRRNQCEVAALPPG
ncbi:uncharacterized protein PHALS_00268 [Plasmopara halstedii]|uniref:Uncharacterized protein n=1 Tax=Plasmopara halstedii TaxID=4781 RepID=A0A0P1A6N0_PLAHL|nr:uncharacterized protein PHALS_00268 [Plasmopara halstedii]CEG35945.1 hypothetical protein PHALS_00268 [Plasmopara halstedii]|eukprot:XP_024572314.1 hypothetical protein PHALS_00268 [Plasmopara halstedii]